MMRMTIDKTYVSKATDLALEPSQKAVKKARLNLFEEDGKRLENNGFAVLPQHVIERGLLKRIQAVADDLKTISDVVVLIGVGGSYAGAKAVLEATSPYFEKQGVEIVYAGHHLSSTYLSALRKYLQSKRYSIIVISKSGTTVEPAIAFDVLKKDLAQTVSKEALKKRIVAITDPKSGALRTQADQEGYQTFDVPEGVGGRYSVFSAVGLLPLAVGGVDIESLIDGAYQAQKAFLEDKDTVAHQYASLRHALYEQGKRMEIFAYYEPALHAFAEWLKQLFNESEGKDGKGIFMTSAAYTTDLHSIGQFIQDGPKDLFETMITFDHVEEDIPSGIYDTHSVDAVNRAAQNGVFEAHAAGQCPAIHIKLTRRDAYHIGYMMQTMMYACALSATALGVNPFDQPGVEAYKSAMRQHLK